MLAPEGPVVAIGVDNEAQLFFRTGAYDLDYHPDALAWWREFSASTSRRARGIPRMRRAASSGCKFKDAYIARALGDFATMLDEVGLGERRALPQPPARASRAVRPALASSARSAGRSASTPTRRAPSFASCGGARSRATSNASPVPIAFEVGVGFFPWFPPLDASDDADRERDHLLTLLAAGIRGFNLFMAVERDRYYGAAI